MRNPGGILGSEHKDCPVEASQSDLLVLIVMAMLEEIVAPLGKRDVERP